MKKITSKEQLDKLIEKNDGDCLNIFVLLNGGLRSSKDINFEDDNSYWVYNEIDDSEEIIKFKDFDKSIIGEAMSKGALYMY